MQISLVVKHIAISAGGLGSITGSVSSVVKHFAIRAEVWGLNPGPFKSAQCRQRLAIAAMFLRSCVVQTLTCGDGARNTLHAST